MITTIQFKTLDDLYRFYNQAIFGGELSDCIVNMSRHGGAYGFFAANRWRGENETKKIIHEISINPDFMNRDDIEWHSTLVHEMCISGRRISANRAVAVIITGNGLTR